MFPLCLLHPSRLSSLLLTCHKSLSSSFLLVFSLYSSYSFSSCLFFLPISSLLLVSSAVFRSSPHACLLPMSPVPSALPFLSSLLYPLIGLFCLISLYSPPLSFICFASSPRHLSCGPDSPITAGGNYGWKVIRRSLNNYPLMQLIDFPFQELCFLSPGSVFSSSLPELACLFSAMFCIFWGQAKI